jgi:hypothetical protein
MKVRTIAGLAFAFTLAAPVGLMLGNEGANATTPPAQKCGVLSGTATITPGLTTTPANQTISATGNAKNCLPSAKTGGAGVLKATVKLSNGSCGGLASGTTLPLKGSIKWQNGKTSAVSITAKTTSSAPTTATLTGKVTSGLFASHLISGKITFTVQGGNCSPSSPIKKITFVNKDQNGKVVPFLIK